jgi:hypothetical protein
MDTYNPLDEMPQERTELEEMEQENFKLRMKIQDYEIAIAQCIEILEETESTLILNKLKKL